MQNGYNSAELFKYYQDQIKVLEEKNTKLQDEMKQVIRARQIDSHFQAYGVHLRTKILQKNSQISTISSGSPSHSSDVKNNLKLVPGKGGNPMSSKLVPGLGGSNVKISFKDINTVGYDEELSKLRRLCMKQESELRKKDQQIRKHQELKKDVLKWKVEADSLRKLNFQLKKRLELQG